HLQRLSLHRCHRRPHPHSFPTRRSSDLRVLPGVRNALAGLAAEPTMHQGVLTGNTAEVARIKLEAFGLDRHLDLSTSAFGDDHRDRKSTRLNSSHVKISYAVFCLKKKKQ